MVNSKLNRLKSTLLSGLVAVSACAGPIASTAVSPSTTAVAAENTDNYARLLQYSLYFYDANMCGDITGCGLSWRGNCHTDDAVPGGFHDAGDHVMFGQPQGYTASTLGWAYYEFPDAFNETGQAEHLKLITDKFCKFFRDATELNGNTVSRVLVEKGEGDTDHSYWGPPEKQGSRGRDVWSTGGAANITAEYAAALAANYVNFKNPDDLKYAEALYDFSIKDRGIYVSYGRDGAFYEAKWTGADDEIAWAAAWLYKATNNDKYLSELKKAPTAYSAHSWESVQLGASMLKGEFTGDWNGTDYLGNFSGNDYCFAADSWKWGSARYNCSAQFTTLVAAKNNKGTADWAKGQMEYILGKKGVGSAPARCFVVGFDSTSPVNVHHRAASGYQSYDEMGDSTVAKQGSPVLVGALAGGPEDKNGTYSDSIKDYVANEVALDYNAGLVGAAAGLYHFYKSGKIDNNIVGVTKIYNGSIEQPTSEPTTSSVVTTTSNQEPTQPVTTTSSSSSGNGTYEIKPDEHYDYKKDMGMIGWKWSEFKIPRNEKITKVEIDISSNSNIGKWQGAFGSSTTVKADEYWTMTDQMEEKFNSNKGTITWDIPTATSNIIQTEYNGELKFGTWWIDSQEFNVDAIRVYTDGSSQPTTAAPTTSAPTTSSTKRTKNGDANCDREVNMSDVVMVMQCSLNPGKYGLGKAQGITETGYANADVNGDSSVDAKDALLIQKFSLELISSFPID